MAFIKRKLGSFEDAKNADTNPNQRKKAKSLADPTYSYLDDPDFSENFKPALLIIFSYLNVADLTNASYVKKEWNALVMGDYWKRVVEYTLGENAKDHLLPLIEEQKIDYQRVVKSIPRVLFHFIDQVTTLHREEYQPDLEFPVGESQSLFLRRNERHVVCTYGAWVFTIIEKDKITIEHPRHGCSTFQPEPAVDVHFTHIADDGKGKYLFAFCSSSGVIYQIDYKNGILSQTYETDFHFDSSKHRDVTEKERLKAVEWGYFWTPVRKVESLAMRAFFIKNEHIFLAYKSRAIDVIDYSSGEARAAPKRLDLVDLAGDVAIDFFPLTNAVLIMGQERAYEKMVNFFSFDLATLQNSSNEAPMTGAISCFSIHENRLFTLNTKDTYYLAVNKEHQDRKEKIERENPGQTYEIPQRRDTNFFDGYTLSMFDLETYKLLDKVKLDHTNYRSILVLDHLILLFSMEEDEGEETKKMTIIGRHADRVNKDKYVNIGEPHTDCMSRNAISPDVLSAILEQIQEVPSDVQANPNTIFYLN